MADKSAKNLPKPVRCDSARVQLELTERTLPLSLSIEVPGGRAQRVLERGIRLPHRQVELYSTTDPYQLSAEFHIVLGERPLARDNLDAARVRVRNVKWSGAGVPKLEIAFDVDKNGLITITAANRDRNSTEMLAHVSRSSLTTAEIEAALADAKAHQEEDARHEENISTMLSGYYLLDQAYERFALAKKRMGFTRKRAYKSTRKRLQNALNVMPPEATEASMAELDAALEAFHEAYDDMEVDYKKVKSWWDKK